MGNENAAFVTGGGGFIGSNLIKLLLHSGYKVICLAFPGEDLERLKGMDVQIIYGDLTKPDQWLKTLPDVQYVFHLAAKMGGGNNPEQIKDVNINGSTALINHYAKNGKSLKRFLFVSSVAAVGESGCSGKLDEKSRPNPKSVYGESKLEVEAYLVQLQHKIPFTIVRLPLVYGPGSRRGLLMLFKIINKGVRPANLRNRLNVGFIEDITNGIKLAAESEISLNRTYFLGENMVYNGEALMDGIALALAKRTVKLPLPYWLIYFICSAIEKTCDLIGKNPPLRSDSIKSYFKANWSISVDRAEKEFAYRTRYPLERGLKLTAEWYKKNNYL